MSGCGYSMGLSQQSMDSENKQTSDDITYQYQDLPYLNSPKVDPSYKSKRYRDKLRTEIKALEDLLPVDKSTLHRKLDSQTVFRLVIAYFRTKMFLGAGIKQRQCQLSSAQDNVESISENITRQWEELNDRDLLQVLDGFLLVVTADGTILYVSKNIINSLGFNQVDLMHRCIYGIVHPDDHHELKMVLETSLHDTGIPLQKVCSSGNLPTGDSCKSVSFLVRIKCFNGTTTGYLKMQCTGHLRAFPGLVKSPRSSNQVVFALCRPFQSLSTDPQVEAKSTGFWTKHGLDLRFKHFDPKASDVTGYTTNELEGRSFYSLVHPEDLVVFKTCHQILIHTEEIQTMYFRIELKNSNWLWVHTRGKVVFRNSKKYSIVFTHCPVREEDSTYIQQEAVIRRHYALFGLMNAKGHVNKHPHGFPSDQMETTDKTEVKGPARVGFISQDFSSSTQSTSNASCPSTWHSKSECHSPVFPTTSLPRRYNAKEKDPNEVYSARKSQQERIEYLTQSPGGKSGHQGLQQQQQQPACMLNHSTHSHCAATPLLPLESSITDFCRGANQKPRLARATHCVGEGAAPCMRYLMQVNGVGVSGEPTPTTLFFQGQLTAFETPTSDYLSQESLRYGSQSSMYSCSYGSLCHSSPLSIDRHVNLPRSNCERLHEVIAEKRSKTAFPVVNRISENERRGGNKRSHEPETFHMPFSKGLVKIPSPRHITSPREHQNDPQAPCGDFRPWKQDCCYHNAPNTMSEAGYDSGSCSTGGKIGGTAVNCPLQGKAEAREHLPSCLYEGSGVLTPEVRCFHPATSPHGMLPVKHDRVESADRKSGGVDLPNIGSFLECLKDISG